MHSTLPRPPHREWSRELPSVQQLGKVVLPVVIPVGLLVQQRRRRPVFVVRLVRRWDLASH
ncbi:MULTISPECIES: hypothetical protein [Streptomyces]|jgi:hypothetical protein|uniref:hypothetical protein n=1 Tax=Streptomyces TaxID=1883 RepID=UPI001B3734CA|nr:hypothetical protein [Streptomyces sp. RK62]MBQ1000340.1 hypothetical protein [Streptomyces sp. RK62]